MCLTTDCTCEIWQLCILKLLLRPLDHDAAILNEIFRYLNVTSTGVHLHKNLKGLISNMRTPHCFKYNFTFAIFPEKLRGHKTHVTLLAFSRFQLLLFFLLFPLPCKQMTTWTESIAPNTVWMTVFVWRSLKIGGNWTLPKVKASPPRPPDPQDITRWCPHPRDISPQVMASVSGGGGDGKPNTWSTHK